MVSSSEFLVQPHFVTVKFALEPLLNQLDTMVSVLRAEEMKGLGEWPDKTFANMTPAQREQHELVFDGFGYLFYVYALKLNLPDFLSLLDHLAALPGETLRDIMLDGLREKAATYRPDEPAPDRALLLADQDVFINWLNSVWPDYDHGTPVYRQVHRLLNDTDEMKALLVSYPRQFWAEHVKPEWDRVLPKLKASVAAFQALDWSSLSADEAVRTVTGREVPRVWDQKLKEAQTLTFVPAAHLGPYLVILGEEGNFRVLFGVRMPKGSRANGATLGRSELLVRLNALADDTRLRILELLTQEGELCAQDIITRLDLSQSSVSRHLGQLAASGYVTERRRDVAKCYTVNAERVRETLQGLETFLLAGQTVRS